MLIASHTHVSLFPVLLWLLSWILPPVLIGGLLAAATERFRFCSERKLSALILGASVGSIVMPCGVLFLLLLPFTDLVWVRTWGLALTMAASVFVTYWLTLSVATDPEEWSIHKERKGKIKARAEEQEKNAAVGHTCQRCKSKNVTTFIETGEGKWRCDDCGVVEVIDR